MKTVKKLSLAVIALSLAFTSCKKAPTASFEVPEGTLYTTKDIKFTNDSDGGGLDYSWTFEGAESTSSSQENPTAVWAEPGTYKVSLIASNKKGDAEASEMITVEEYVPFIRVKNNTLTAIGVRIGLEGKQNGEDDLSWWFWGADTKGYAMVEPGETVDVKLWDEGDDKIDFTGKDKLYYAIFSWDFDRGCSVYTVDAEDGSSLLAWHSESLEYVDMDTYVEVDVSQDFFYVTMDNTGGYSNLEGVYAYMGSEPGVDQVGYANVTIPYDLKKDVGYFDAYAGVNIASFINNTQFLYWTEGNQFEFAEGMENFKVTLANDGYKSGKTKAIATYGKVGAPLEGAIKMNAPRKVKMNDEAFKALNK